MGFRLFGRGDGGATRICLPDDYRSTVRWLPRLGDRFPDFFAKSTYGDLGFHDWAAGSWVYLFSHPAAFSPVCSSEIVDTANRHDAFVRLGIKPILIACTPAADLTRWAEDVERVFDVQICFPMVADPRAVIARAANMIHPRESAKQPIRKSFLIDPRMRIRMIHEYPMDVGRNVGEVLRAATALQVAERTGMLVQQQDNGKGPLPEAQAMKIRQSGAKSPDVVQIMRQRLRVVHSRVQPPPQGDRDDN